MHAAAYPIDRILWLDQTEPGERPEQKQLTTLTRQENTSKSQAAARRRTDQGRRKKLDDALLVKRLRNGSEEAFLEFFDLYRDRVFHAAYRILGDSSESEDVVQEVFMKAIRKIDSFNMKSSLYTWLYRIAVNTAVDSRKKIKNKQALSLHQSDGAFQEIPSDQEGPDKQPQRQEMAQLLRGALNELTEKHRTILVLREFEGLSYTELSETLGCSKGTVESRLFRARNRLREKMEKYL